MVCAGGWLLEPVLVAGTWVAGWIVGGAKFFGSEINQIVNNSRTSAIQSLSMRANDAARDSTIRHVFT